MRLNWEDLRVALLLADTPAENISHVLDNVVALSQAYDLSSNDRHALQNDVTDLRIIKSYSPEEYKAKSNHLATTIGNIVDKKPQRKMVNQIWLMEKMSAMGYTLTWQGECYGLSHMAMQAFFAHDMVRFNERLERIYAMPIESFNDHLLQLRDQQAQWMEKKQKDKADEIRDIIVDLNAFFDGVALHQCPIWYFMGKDHQPLSQKQDARKTLPILTPVNLEQKDAQGNRPHRPVLVTAWTGSYHGVGELRSYFRQLREAQGDHDFALTLIANCHAIELMYDHTTKRWLCVDPSHLPGEEYSEELFLGAAVWSSLLAPALQLDTLVMGTQLMVRAEDEPRCLENHTKLCSSAPWLSLHSENKKHTMHPALTLSSATIFGLFKQNESPETLMQTLYDNPESVSVTPQVQWQRAMARKEYDVAMYLIIMNGGLVNTKYGEFNSVWTTRTEEQKQVLFDLLTPDQKIGLMQCVSVPIATHLSKEEYASLFTRIPWHTRMQRLREMKDLTQRQDLFHALIPSEQLYMMVAVGFYDSIFLYGLLTKEERITLFPQMCSARQGLILIHAPKEEQPGLLQLMSLDEKRLFLSGGSAAEVYPFLMCCPEHERDSLFMGLPLSHRQELLLHYDYVVPEPPSGLWSTLFCVQSVQDQVKILRDEKTGRIFARLTMEQQNRLYPQLESKAKANYLYKTVDESQKEFFMSTLTPSQTMEVFKAIIADRSLLVPEVSQLILKLITSMPPEERLSACQWFVSGGSHLNLTEATAYTLFSLLPSKVWFTLLSPTYHEFRRQYLSFPLFYQRLPLYEVKKMLLLQLQELAHGLPEDERSFFSSLKKRIVQESDRDFLDELFLTLVDYMQHPPTSRALVESSRALTTDEAVQPTDQRTLADRLLSLGLTQDNLSARSIRRCFKTFHPDSSTQSGAAQHQAFDDLKFLQVFFSSASMLNYRDDASFHREVDESLAGLTPDEQSLLLRHSLATLEADLVNHPPSAAVHTMLVQIRLAYEAHNLSVDSVMGLTAELTQLTLHPEEPSRCGTLLTQYKPLMSASWASAADRLLLLHEHRELFARPTTSAFKKQLIDAQATDEGDENAHRKQH